MNQLTAWCIPASAFWSWKDQIAVFYDGWWIATEPSTRIFWTRIYGVAYR